MVKFITYLSGDRNWLHPHSALPAVRPDTLQVIHLREILGTESLQNCVTLYRLCNALPVIAPLLPKEDVNMDLAAIQQLATDSEAVLVATGAGTSATLPIDTGVTIPTAIRLRYVADDKAEIRVGDKKLIISVGYANGVLIPHWPKELPINGLLRLPADKLWGPGMTVTVPSRFKYPVSVVDKQLCRSEEVYQILFDQGMVDTFYSADSPEERISIAILALINLVK
jgi:hypothetical protein